MKKIVILFFAVIFAASACVSPPPPPDSPPPPPPPPPGVEDPGVGPAVSAAIPELFSPDLDADDYSMTIALDVTHSVPVRDWNIRIQPNRQQRQDAQAAPRQETAPRQTAPRQTAEGEGTRRQAGERRRAFFEQDGTGDVPAQWQWNGRGLNGEMVQSAMEYRFTLTVNDVFGNAGTYEGIINTDVLVRREGDHLRIIVPSIVFQGNSANFTDVSGTEITDEIIRANRRILTLIARALNRFGDYRITVEGHTNPGAALGTPARTAENSRNLPISQARADAVVNYLVANLNINRSRLTAVGRSATRTITEDYDNDDENWKNRRVEFILQR